MESGPDLSRRSGPAPSPGLTWGAGRIEVPTTKRTHRAHHRSLQQHRRRPPAQGARASRQAREHLGARDRGALRRGARAQDGRVPGAPRQRSAPRRPPSRGVRQHARGRAPHDRAASLRRPADGRSRAAPRRDRGDAHRRGEDAGLHAPRLPERPRGRGRPPRDGQRLPGQARLGVDGRHLSVPGARGRIDPVADEPRTASAGLRRRHHVRHEQRVRLRLPARQHGDAPGAHGPARPPFRDRGRGRLDPDRRGADPADHQRHGPRQREVVPDVRADRAAAHP